MPVFKKTNKKINFLFSLDELLLNNLKLLSFSTFLILLKVKENKRLQLLAWVYSMKQQVEAIHRVIRHFNEAFESQKTVVSCKKRRKTQKVSLPCYFLLALQQLNGNTKNYCLLLTTKYIVLDRLISLEDE